MESSFGEYAVFALKTLLNFYERSCVIPINLNFADGEVVDPYGDVLREAIRCVKIVNGIE